MCTNGETPVDEDIREGFLEQAASGAPGRCLVPRDREGVCKRRGWGNVPGDLLSPETPRSEAEAEKREV